MNQAKVPYEKILFVCTNVRETGTCCSGRNSVVLREALKQYVKEHGLQGRIRISQSGCQDLCAQGPNIMVFPDNVWYHHVTLAQVPEIVEAHLAPLDASTKPLTGGV